MRQETATGGEAAQCCMLGNVETKRERNERYMKTQEKCGESPFVRKV